MACALPWMMREGPTYSKHIPTLPDKWGEGEVTKNVRKKKNTKKIKFIYIRAKCSKF